MSDAAASLAPDRDQAALRAVRALEQRRIEAMRANDSQALDALLHDDLIYVNSFGEVEDKHHYLRDIRTHRLTYSSDFNVRETEYRLFDNLVVLCGIMLGHSRLDREQQVFGFRSLSIWRKGSAGWRMLAWQSSSGSPAV